MWIEFLRDIDVAITSCMTRCYKRGMRLFVHEKHARQILAAEAGRVIAPPAHARR